MSKQIGTQLAIGGLMRCCTSTLDEWIVEHAEEETVEGQTLQCKYTDNEFHRMILKKNVWQWDHEPITPRKGL
jgi:hypothetical protein